MKLKAWSRGQNIKIRPITVKDEAPAAFMGTRDNCRKRDKHPCTMALSATWALVLGRYLASIQSMRAKASSVAVLRFRLRVHRRKVKDQPKPSRRLLISHQPPAAGWRVSPVCRERISCRALPRVRDRPRSCNGKRRGSPLRHGSCRSRSRRHRRRVIRCW